MMIVFLSSGKWIHTKRETQKVGKKDNTNTKTERIQSMIQMQFHPKARKHTRQCWKRAADQRKLSLESADKWFVKKSPWFPSLSSSFFKSNDFIQSKYSKILVSSVFRKFQDLTILTPSRRTILTSRWLTTITTRNRKNQSSQTLMLLTFLPRDKLCVYVCLEMFSMFDV